LTWELFDETVRIISPRSVVTLLNNVYAWTTQGVVAINDTGVEIISRPIEKTLTDAYNNLPSGAKEQCFAVANEVERTLHLYVPTSNNAPSTQCFVFNTITRTWTREVVTTQATAEQIINGAVGRDEYGKLHRASVTVSGKFLIQRNTQASADYQDIGGTPQTADNGVYDNEAFFSVNPNFQPNDVVITDEGTTHVVQTVTFLGSEWQVIFFTDDVPLTATTFALCTAISSAWQYAPITGGNPDQLKLFRQAQVLFQNAHARTMQATFSTELITNVETQTIDLQTITGQWAPSWDGLERPFNLSVLIPQEMRRSTRLNAKITLNGACQAFSVNGLSIRLSPSGDKVSK